MLVTKLTPPLDGITLRVRQWPLLFYEFRLAHFSYSQDGRASLPVPVVPFPIFDAANSVPISSRKSRKNSSLFMDRANRQLRLWSVSRFSSRNLRGRPRL